MLGFLFKTSQDSENLSLANWIPPISELFS